MADSPTQTAPSLPDNLAQNQEAQVANELRRQQNEERIGTQQPKGGGGFQVREPDSGQAGEEGGGNQDYKEDDIPDSHKNKTDKIKEDEQKHRQELGSRRDAAKKEAGGGMKGKVKGAAAAAVAQVAMKHFPVALGLAIFKDIVDVPGLLTLGTIGSAINVVVSLALLQILNSQGPSFKKWFMKKMVTKFVLAIMAEFIPGVNFFPWYVINIITIKLASNKEISKKKDEAKKILAPKLA